MNIWKCDKLKGHPNYEELISLTSQFDKNPNTLKSFILDKLNSLLHQLSVIEQPTQQLKFLAEILAWFKKHSGELQEPQKPITHHAPIKLKKIKIKKKTEEQEREKKRNLDEWRFLIQKQRDLNKWALSQNRSKEEFMYRLEVKARSHKYLKRRSSFVSPKTQEMKEKFKIVELVRRREKSTKLEYKPDINEVEELKRKLSGKGISISSKILEPVSFYLTPSGKGNESRLSFPDSGEGLLKKRLDYL